MELCIDNVESLTINLSSGSKPSLLADLLTSLSVSPLSSRAPAPSAPAAKIIKTPRIGEYWAEQGGIFGGMMRGIDGAPDSYLIAPVDALAVIDEIAWQAGEPFDTDAKSDRDGAANTAALVRSEHDFPAAQWASKLVIKGFSDFFLPSRREIALAWINIPEIFTPGSYWTSTQCSRNYAWAQYFDDGSQDLNYKSAQLRARAFRRFIP